MHEVDLILEITIELSLIATGAMSPIPGAFRLIFQWLGV